MKTSNKSKGFTLIELMVVIAIIALLSSVVLASLKGAREKAQITKTVGEMKSLQTALELYRNQFGVYPGGVNQFNADSPTEYDLFGDQYDSIIQTSLVEKKFISKIPHAPNYPNNCTVDGETCFNKGYVLGYVSYPQDPSRQYKCGNEIVNNYLILFIAPPPNKINLPTFYIRDLLGGNNWQPYNPYGLDNTYCLSG